MSRILHRHQIELEKPIKSSGTFEVTIKVHPQIQCIVKVHVNTAEGAEGSKDGDSEASE